MLLIEELKVYQFPKVMVIMIQELLPLIIIKGAIKKAKNSSNKIREYSYFFTQVMVVIGEKTGIV